MNIKSDTITKKPFLPILRDAILYAKYSSLAQNKKIENLLAKSSILNCSFAVEALANNLIQFVKLDSKFQDSIDKLDTIAKFEFFSILLKNKNFDRGKSNIQFFQELIRLRNNYVHPKIKEQIIYHKDGQINPLKKIGSSCLSLSYDSDDWSHKDAQKCSKSLLKSIDQFLLVDFEFEKKSLTCMFTDFLSINGNKGPLMVFDEEWSDWAECELNYRPAFFCDHILKRFN